MIVERHYDDETLIGLLGTNVEVVRDPHLAVCSSCSESLASYRAIADVLSEDRAWDGPHLRPEPVPETMSALRMFSAAMIDEEELAAAAVQRLLALAPDEQFRAVSRDLEMMAPAVVRALVAESEASIDASPRDACAIAALAAHIASLLTVGDYPGDVVRRACGAAYRQLGFTAFYVGDYDRAADAVERAWEAFEACKVSDYDLARVSIVRGLILTGQERHEEALMAARSAAQIFEAFGDRRRMASAKEAEAYSLMHQLRYREALPILLDIEENFKEDVDSDARALTLGNLALCQCQLGRVREALDLYQISATIYQETGNLAGAARNRYNVACILAQHGQLAEAKTRLAAIREEFRRLGMPQLVVTASLDLAELLLAEENYLQAAQLCAAAVEHFQATGLAETTQGLIALRFLHEASAGRRATPAAVRQVKTYLERLPKEPALLFAPPPLSMD